MNFVKTLIAGAALALGATTANAATLAYSEDTGNFYEVVYGTANYATALADAESSTYSYKGETVSGSLLAIESWAERDFILNTFGTSTVFWVAASDAATEGEWIWTSGENAGESINMALLGSMWVGGAPNDTFAGQDYALLNVVPSLLFAKNPNDTYAYIIEYAGLPPVPLPAGLPLAAGAFGLMALVRKRRKTA